MAKHHFVSLDGQSYIPGRDFVVRIIGEKKDGGRHFNHGQHRDRDKGRETAPSHIAKLLDPQDRQTPIS